MPDIESKVGAPLKDEELAYGADRLRQLDKFLLDQEPIVYEYGKFLADRVGPDMHPVDFVLATTLAVYDLNKGIDGWTNEPIRNSLVGYPEFIYSILFQATPIIARATYSEEFATQVEEIVQEANKQSS